jgi:hypothetical protein
MPEPEPTPDEMLASTKPVPASYFNGFQLSLTNADIGLLTLLDNQPVLKLSMSYTTAKTLLVKLSEAIGTLESLTGREIMTSDDAGQGLAGRKAK